MKLKLFIILGGIALLSSLILSSCGDSGGPQQVNPGPIGPGGCSIPGTVCNIPGGVGGVQLLNGPTLSTLDSRGSFMQLNFGAAGNVIANNQYNGPVQISGLIRMNRQCGFQFINQGAIGGDFTVQGQGQWNAGYGGAVARVTGQLVTNNGSQVQLGSSLIQYGQTHVNGAVSQFFLEGQVYIQMCNGVFTALRY